jgi:monovalent cation:H+ antiporter-2, CPA2 family
MALEFDSPGFSDSLVILGAAGIVIPAFARFRITPVIGFILVGIIAGPFGLGAWVADYPWLSWVTISEPKAMAPFAELGIILLLFCIGLELSFGRLWGMRKKLVGFGGSELIGSGLLIAAALIIFGENPPAALGLGLALALSSTALVLPIAGTTSPVGRLALAMLLFEDLALVPIIFFLGVLAAGVDGAGLSELGATAGLGLVIVAAMMILGPRLLPPLFAQAARTKSPELFLAVSLLIVIFSSFATGVIGLSPIVGALVAGLLIAETKYVGEVEAMILPFKGLALGIFLITVGMSLDLGMIIARWDQVLMAVTGVILIKVVVTTGLLRLGGVSSGVATETGVLMASPSETTLIVLAAAATAGLIGGETADFWTVVTALGLTITPLLARVGHDMARRIEWQESGRDQPDEPMSADPRAIIIGFGRVGRLVAEMLEAHRRPYVAMEFDVDLVTVALREGKPIRFGDAGRRTALDLLHPETATAIVLTMDDPVQAVRLTADLRARFPAMPIIARARDVDHAAELYKAGATDAVPETLESSLQLSEAVLVDLGVAMGPVIASIHEKRDELRGVIKSAADLDEEPRLGPLRTKMRGGG